MHDLLNKATRFLERIDMVACVALVLRKERAVLFDVIVSITLVNG